MTTTTPRVYVACLASYNAGELHGAWIDADQDPDDLLVEIQTMLGSAPHKGEEWAIHDYEDFDSLDLGEHPSLDKISLHGRMIAEHGEAWIAYVGNVGKKYADESGFEEAYVGEYDSEKDYAEELVDALGVLDEAPEICRQYFDYEAYSRDMFCGDYWSADAGGGRVYVFRSI